MKTLQLVLAVLLLSAVSSFRSKAAAQTTSLKGGSLCVLPNSPDPPTRISPGGEYNPATLTVRVDKRQSIRWPHKEPVLVDSLALQKHHLVILTSDG
jgi:hypothetical protein